MANGMPHTLRKRVAVLALSVVAVFALGQPQRAAAQGRNALPSAPYNPTMQDCQNLDQHFYAILSQLHASNRECMRQSPVFGYVSKCNGGTEMRAWSQCQPIELELCRTEDARQRELATCRARASSVEDEAKRIQIKRANDEYEKARNIVKLLTRPQSFLRSVFSSFPKAMDSIFGQSRTDFDSTLALELYRYAHNQAMAGTSAIPNSLASAFTREALSHLGQIHRQAIRDLDSASDRIRQFGNEFRPSPPAARSPPPTPPPRAPAASSGSPDCVWAQQRHSEYASSCKATDGCRSLAASEEFVRSSCQR